MRPRKRKRRHGFFFFRAPASLSYFRRGLGGHAGHRSQRGLEAVSILRNAFPFRLRKVETAKSPKIKGGAQTKKGAKPLLTNVQKRDCVFCRLWFVVYYRADTDAFDYFKNR